MSLQLWLPLDGNLKNQGVLNTPIPTTSVSFATGGKIANKCLKSSTKAIYDVSAGNISTRQMTVSFWGRGDNYTGTSTAWWQICSFTCNDNSSFHIYCVPNGRYKMEYKPELNTYCDTSVWHHITYVLDGTTLTTYVDGIQSATANTANDDRTLTSISIGVNTVSVNDFRVYNHCLSPKEIKMISQGMILHMPLKDAEGEGTTNIAPYPTPGDSVASVHAWDSALHANAIGVSGWASGYNGGVGTPASGYHAHWELIDGLPTMVFPDLNSYLSLGHRWLGINALDMQKKIGPSTTYTVSFDARADVHNMFLRVGYYYRITGATSNSFHDGYGDFHLSTQWKRYSCTFTTKSTLNTAISAPFYFYGHYGSVYGTSYVRNVQIELKDHATAYTKDTRTSTLMDCSGYGRHGEGVGTLITNANSARYDNCIYISDGRTNYGKSGSLTMPTDEITISCWIKTSTTGYSSYHIPVSFNGANYELSIDASGHFRNGFTIGSSRSVLTTSHTSILDGQWHMITATYDGATIRRYLDGNELTSYATAIVGSLVGGTNNLLIGNYNGTTYGNKETYMSDVRVYATALNAEDIKTLYQTRISMLDNGAIVAYEYKEGELNNIKFTEEGLARAGSIGEVNYIGGMKTRVLPDGSAWARIHWLNLEFDKTVFADDNEVAFCDESNRFSRMGLVDHFKTAAGVYEFMLTYPKLSATAYNRWQQTNSPNVAANAGTGHVKITTAWATHSSPITKSASSGSATYSMNSANNWWAPIGQKTLFQSTGIPAADSSTQLETELWVRIDNLPAITKLSLLDNKYIQATEIYEI